MNPSPQLLPVGAVRDDRYLPYKITPDLPGGEKVLSLLRAAGIPATPVPPAPWALEFRQALEDAVLKHRGPELRRAMTRLMKHPRYRDAHGTDDHFMANLFVAGAAGAPEDVGPNTRLAECWELVNMCNTQFQLGAWE